MSNASTAAPIAKAGTVDITPNITAEQAKRMETALERRQAAESEISRIVIDALPNCTQTLSGAVIMERGTYAELRELVAEWKVANRAFEAAVFERPATPAPTPDLRADDLVAASEGGAA
jgi:hypothetical protein